MTCYDEGLLGMARNLVLHSIGGQLQERGKSLDGLVLGVKGEEITRPLAMALRHVAEQNGVKTNLFIHSSEDIAGYKRIRSAISKLSEEELKNLLAGDNGVRKFYDSCDALVVIQGTENPPITNNNLVIKNRDDFLSFSGVKPWLITSFPCESEARKNGFLDNGKGDINKYGNVLLAAGSIDYNNLRERVLPVAELLRQSSNIKVVSNVRNVCFELNMNKKEHFAPIDYGLNNFPDGEFFTSPIPSAVSGKIYIEGPTMHNGKLIQDLGFVFESGKIKEIFGSDESRVDLEKMLVDEGSRMLGEIGFGSNYAISEGMSVLLGEKKGGTFHLALGRSLEDCYSELVGLKGDERKRAIDSLSKAGNFVVSSRHIDLICGKVGQNGNYEIYFDSHRVWWDEQEGRWVHD